MKFQSNTLLPELSRASIQRLTRFVKETPDVITGEKKMKRITAIDLWKIHNQKRIFPVRRFS